MYCFIDFEFINTSNEKCIQRACLSVGAVYVDQKFEVIKDFYQVIHPPFEIESTQRLERTRGWEEALPFTEVYQLFKEWLPKENVVCYTFGRFDQIAFREDCQRFHLEDFLTPRWKDYQHHLIEQWNERQGEPWRDAQPSLEWMKRRLGNQHPFVSHNALEDAYDLMLIAKSFETGEPMEDNPLHTQYHQSRMNQASLAPQHTVESLTHSVDILTKYGTHTLSKSSKKKRKSVPNCYLYWQGIILRRNEKLYTFDYYNQSKQSILKGDCRLIQGEWVYRFSIQTDEGNLLVENGILSLHLRIRQEYAKTFVTKHQLPHVGFLYLRLTHKGDISTCPEPVRFHQGWGFVQVVWGRENDEVVPLGYRLSFMSLNLEYQLRQEEVWREEGVSVNDFLFKLYQTIEQHPYIKFYTLNHETLSQRFEVFGFSTNRLRNLGAIIKKRFGVLGWEFENEEKALVELANQLKLTYRHKDLEFRTLEQMIQIYRWDRNIILSTDTPNLLNRQLLRVRALRFNPSKASEESDETPSNLDT